MGTRNVSARALVVVTLAGAGLGAGVFACGGSDGGSIAPAGADPSSATEGGIVDGDGGGGYTLDDVCDVTGPKVCAARASCCASTGGYSESGCLAHTNAGCTTDVEAVRAGRETFHPERIDACLAKLNDVLSTCYVTFDALYRLATDLHDCNIFEGSLAEGAACERDSECKPSPNASDFTGCDDKTKVCKTTRFLSESEACSLADGLPNLCSKGLYCDADFALSPPSGSCKTATPIGQPCNGAKPLNLECGLGNYCDTSAVAGAVCTVGKPGGAACATDLECAALSCAGVDGGQDAGKTCVFPAPITKPEECKGP